MFPRGIWGAYKSLVAARPYIYTADALADLITGTMQARAFADLAVPFAAVATDMADGQATLLRDGPLRPALLASAAIPAVFPWVEIGGRRYVDGGVASNVPVREACVMGAASLVVLDCGLLGIPGQQPHSIAESLIHAGALLAASRSSGICPRSRATVRSSTCRGRSRCAASRWTSITPRTLPPRRTG